MVPLGSYLESSMDVQDQDQKGGIRRLLNKSTTLSHPQCASQPYQTVVPVHCGYVQRHYTVSKSGTSYPISQYHKHANLSVPTQRSFARSHAQPALAPSTFMGSISVYIVDRVSENWYSRESTIYVYPDRVGARGLKNAMLLDFIYIPRLDDN
jgi:hypothetical protein